LIALILLIVFLDFSRGAECRKDFGRVAVNFLKDKGSSELSEVVTKLNVSVESARVFISRLIRSGKIRITGIKAV
jgi:hypothetical protein